MSGDQPERESAGAELDRAAAEWVARLDRGLTAAEQDAYLRWLAEDPRHRQALAEHRWGWSELDRLAGFDVAPHEPADPRLLATLPVARATTVRGSRSRRVVRFAFAAVPALGALAAGVVFLLTRPTESRRPVLAPAAVSTALAAPCERQELPDGSTVELNRGAEIAVAFAAGERRVRLVRGEANFTVARDPARPFLVEVGPVVVRAVGTAFNVRVGADEVEVVVTEGRVQLDRRDSAERDGLAGSPPLLGANDRALVPLVAAPARPPAITRLTDAEVAARLVWQPRLLDFTRAPLGEVVGEFNRRNVVQLTVTDAELRTLRLSATIRSDNVAGFVRLMVSDFGMRAEWRSATEVVLTRAP